MRLNLIVGTDKELADFRELILNVRQDQVGKPYTLRLEKGHRRRLQERADKIGIAHSELLRVIIEASINCPFRDLVAFIKLGIMMRDEKIVKGKISGNIKS